MKTLVPLGGKDSIVQISFGFEWRNPLSPFLFSLLSSLHKNIKNDFPRKQEISDVISIKNKAGKFPESTSDNQSRTSLIIFDALKADGNVKHQIQINQTSIVYNNFESYSGWGNEQDHALAVLEPFLSVLFREVKFVAFGIQYFNAFGIDKTDGLATLVFDDQSEFLPPYIFKLNDLWHVHQGFFEEAAEPITHKRLINFDIQVVLGDNDLPKLEIRSISRAIINGDTHIVKSPNETNTIKELQSLLHNRHKDMLRNILNSNVCKYINLDGKE